MSAVLFAVARATTPDGGPDALVTSDCSIDQSGFADLDADGIDDLVLQVEERVYGWPSSYGGGTAPIRLEAEGAEPEWGSGRLASATNGQPASLHWVQHETATQYEIGTSAFDLAVTWEVTGNRRTGYSWYVGDLDGDGVSELATSNEFRSSAQGDWVPYPSDVIRSVRVTFNPSGFSGVGDLDGDGFGDVVVGWQLYETYHFCTFHRGPASLYLGRPGGLSAEPLWTLWEGTRELSVGQTVISVPEQDALIVDLKIDTSRCNYFGSPLFLGVIRDASTPFAYLSQVVEVPEIDPSDAWYSELVGMVPGPLGPNDVAVMDSTGSGTGVLWYGWDPLTATLSEQPEVIWPSTVEPHYNQTLLAWPVGRRNQAMSMLMAPGGYPSDVAVWGRTVADVGPATTGSTADGECTFYAKGPPPPPPPSSTTTTTGTPPVVSTEPPPEPAGEPVLRRPAARTCGCGVGGGTSGAVLPVLLASLARSRRTARRLAAVTE